MSENTGTCSRCGEALTNGKPCPGGEWVALDGKKEVGRGHNAVEAMANAKDFPDAALTKEQPGLRA